MTRKGVDIRHGANYGRAMSPSPHVIEALSKSLDAEADPALAAAPGTVVRFTCTDQAYRELHATRVMPSPEERNFNLVTGPVAMEGAVPGDAIRVTVLDVAMTSAWAAWLPGYGAFKTDTLHVRPLAIHDGQVWIRDGLSVPLEPMIGCIGLAPAEGWASTVEPAHPFGGNLDLKEVRPGAQVILPVMRDGGLLYIGDLHAAMGDGEPTWLGLEGAGSATVRMDLDKGAALSGPRIETPDHVILIGLGDDLDKAGQAAMDRAFDLLTQEWGLAPFDAFAYASARVHLKLGGPASPLMLAVVPRLPA